MARIRYVRYSGQRRQDSDESGLHPHHPTRKVDLGGSELPSSHKITTDVHETSPGLASSFAGAHLRPGSITNLSAFHLSPRTSEQRVGVTYSISSPEPSDPDRYRCDFLSAVTSELEHTIASSEYTSWPSIASGAPEPSPNSLSDLPDHRIKPTQVVPGLHERRLYHGPSEPLAGIDTIFNRDPCDEQSKIGVDQAPIPDLMMPFGLQHIQQLCEPWSAFESDDHSMQGLESSPTPAPQASSRSDPSPQLPSTQIPERSTARLGRRNGPLAQETRQNAKDVRKERSCLRCFVYKETCDTDPSMCQNCSKKQARTWKLGCVRPRLMFRTDYLLPDILTSRLQKKYVYSFFQRKGWPCRDKDRFAIPLEIGIGPPLIVPVRELLPLTNSDRPAYSFREDGEDTKAVPTGLYDLPVVVSSEREDQAANVIRVGIQQWFQQTLNEIHDERIVSMWFNRESEPFAEGVMQVICKYYRSHIHQHRILHEAVGLAFFNYIFTHSFCVPEDYIPTLQERMEARIPENGQPISPSTVGLFIKMLFLPALKDVIKRALKSLETLLLDQHSSQQWRKDLIFCIAFILMGYIGSTQLAILQYAHQPVQDGREILTKEQAIAQIEEMETHVADLIIKYHEQFLHPSPRRRRSQSSPSMAERMSEDHAEEFKLMERVAVIRRETIKQCPQSFAVNCDQFEDFFLGNTSRLCWKYVNSIMPLDEHEHASTMT